MLKTIQYTYGVIGAAESSTTRATLLVPGGSPAQFSGGVVFFGQAQVNWTGMTLPTNAVLLTVITLGVAISLPDPSNPHPDAGSAQQAAKATAAKRRRMIRPRASFTVTSGPDLIGNPDRRVSPR
jgi:hypothetical protein